MRYYHVWVRSEQFRGAEPLTYKYNGLLVPGTLILAPLRSEIVSGFVVKEVAKPPFATKTVTFVFQLPPLPTTTLKIAQWILAYYPSPIGVITQLFVPAGLQRSGTTIPIQRSWNTEGNVSDDQKLTLQQSDALKAINQPDTYLLHGRTGSGKTRIYSELGKRVIENHRSVLVLSPEIGLTSQTATTFRRSFGDRVVVFHSQLSEKDRTIAWLRILTAQEPLIVIGPRSALFSPLQDIGLIVVDEAHEQAYKQEQAPYYHANRVAAQARNIHGGILIFGSATPSVVDYYLAEKRSKPVIRLDALAKNTNAERSVSIVDLKDRRQFTRSPYISTALITAIEGSLERHEQVLLYLNRRGTARVTLCTHCGWQALCPRCDIPLTYHGDTFTLRCHICGLSARSPINCAVCGNPTVEFRGAGTKAIASEIQRLFPEAHILRLDADTQKSERLEAKFSDILSGGVDILVGTQVLAKGLDLPQLSTLGVITADSSLYLPDYTASERTFQLLTQVIGRIGRGHIASKAIVQTYHPESKLLQYSLYDRWEEFYNDELAERKRYFFPPFCYLLKISCRRTTPEAAEKTAQKMKESLQNSGLHVSVEGPAPSFHEKAAGHYIWQLVLKATSRQALLDAIHLLPSGWSYDLDPSDLL